MLFNINKSKVIHFGFNIIIIIIKNEKIRVTLCENAAGALYIVNKSITYCLNNKEADYLLEPSKLCSAEEERDLW